VKQKFRSNYETASKKICLYYCWHRHTQCGCRFGAVSLYFTPSQVFNGEAPQGRNFRIGGLVVDKSLKRQTDGLTVHFDVTDTAKTMHVTYVGILPDLFKEGKGVVAHGKLEGENNFIADEVLAKHDENYNAAEVVTALALANKAQSGVPSTQAVKPSYKAPLIN
jgi:cytochrome c-type biogenesis protein CcmE